MENRERAMKYFENTWNKAMGVLGKGSWFYEIYNIVEEVIKFYDYCSTENEDTSYRNWLLDIQEEELDERNDFNE